MENLQGTDTKRINRSESTLAGPLTWFLLLIVGLTFIGSVYTIFQDSPARAIRNYFKLCFDGKYEQAWNTYVLEGSNFQKDKGGDLKTFSETWERSKNHGTDYLNVRIDGVKAITQSTGNKKMVTVRFSLMQYDEDTKEKESGNTKAGMVKVKVLQDSYSGNLVLQHTPGKSWQIVSIGQ